MRQNVKTGSPKCTSQWGQVSTIVAAAAPLARVSRLLKNAWNFGNFSWRSHLKEIVNLKQLAQIYGALPL